MRSTTLPLATRFGRTRGAALGLALALALLGVLAGSLLPTAGPGLALAQEPPARGGRVLDSLISEPDSLDPARANLLVSQYVLGLLYDRLVYIDQTGRPRPWLAESWSVDKDGREVTFVIRKGVTFTDGTPLDAEAVRYSLDRYLKLSKRNADLGPVQKIEVVGGGSSVRLTFERPFAALFTALDFSYLGIVSKAAAEKAGDEFGRRPVGTGPYTLKEWKAGSSLLFARNAGYRNLRADVENKGAPYPDEWQISIVKEEGTRMAALETGQLHMSWAPFEEVPRIQKDPRLQLFRRPKGVSYIFLEFNTKKPPFDKLALRRAIAFSVDSKEVLDASYLYGTVIQAPLPLGVPGFSAEVGRQHGYRRDEAKAVALFKEAGFTKGADGKLRDGAGKPVRITLTTWVAPQISPGRPGHPGPAPGRWRGVRAEPVRRGRVPGQAARGEARLRPHAQTFPDPHGLCRWSRAPAGGTTTATRSSTRSWTRPTDHGSRPADGRAAGDPEPGPAGRGAHPALQRRLHDRGAQEVRGFKFDGDRDAAVLRRLAQALSRRAVMPAAGARGTGPAGSARPRGWQRASPGRAAPGPRQGAG